jgi:hypothetical protein
MADEYLVLDESFTPSPAGFTADPTDWTNPACVPVSREEPLESALVFHLELLTGCPLHFLMRARPKSPRPDVVAMDDRGRIHVLEVKRDGKADPDAARQLLRYLGKTADLVEHVTRDRAGRRGSALHDEAVVLDYLLGALVDARMDVKSAKSREDRVLRAGLDPAAESARLVPAARRLTNHLAAECTTGLAVIRRNPTPAVVGWLVAPRITPKARTVLAQAAAPIPELHLLELEIARLPPRRWVVRRGVETVLPARP